MKCSSCQHENADEAKFCNECGGDLRKTAQDFSKDISLPREDSLKLSEDKTAPFFSAVEGERKYVTVLFSDLSGYTAMSDRLDPEEVKEIMGQIFGDVSQIVYKYGGFIEKFIGDAVMALFGVPQAHEDDPVRAIRAAREMHERIETLSPKLEEKVGQPLSLHTGIHTGLVVTGEVDLEKGTHGVLGDTINLASRLMSHAKPGEILIGQNTYRQVEAYFNFKDLGNVRVKGKVDPVQVYRVKDLKEIPDHAHFFTTERINSPLVGRDTELSILYDCVERLYEGQGNIISVMGEAGIGKSRLISEIFDYTKNNNKFKKPQWLEGEALSYGQTISYWPFIEIFRRYAGITENDKETSSWNKLENSITDLFPEQAEEILPYIASLMNLTLKAEFQERTKYLDGDAMGHQIFLASYRFFEQLSKSKSIMLVFEDLHWMDESSASLLEHLMPLTTSLPLLIIGIFRPDPNTSSDRFRRIAHEKYPDSYYEISLSPLHQTDCINLVGKLLNIENLSPQIYEKIIEKAEGNPFFVEEIVRSLLDAEAIIVDEATGQWKATEQMETTSIPDTIQGVISARIDRLDTDVKGVMRVASVIGRSFLYRLLKAIEELETKLEQAIQQLQAIEIIKEKQKIPELEYIFTHALVQQATYESILMQRRRSLHAQVGRTIESLFNERLEEFSGLLAYHYARAEEWDKAHHYLMKAGDQAGKIAADAEALVHYRQALSAYERVFGDEWDPLQRISLERKIGEALYRRGEMKQALEYFLRCLDLLRRPMQTKRWVVRWGILSQILCHIGHRLLPWFHPSPGSKPISLEVEEEDRIYVNMAWIYGYLDPEMFILTVLRRLIASERSGYAYGIATVSTGIGFICDIISTSTLAGYYHSKAVTESEKLKNPEALGLACFGMAYYEQIHGNWTAAIEQGQRGAEAYRKVGDLRGWSEAVNQGIAIPHIYQGHFDEALSLSHELIRVGNEGDDPTILSRGFYIRGFALMRMGQFKDAVPALEKTSNLTESIPDYFTRSDAGGLLGNCYLYMGDLDKALNTLEETERITVEHSVPITFVNFYHCLAECYLVAAEKSKASERAEWLKKARQACKNALKAGRGARARMPEAMMLQGRYMWINGKTNGSKKWWKRSLALAEELQMPYELSKVYRELGIRFKDQSQLEHAKSIFSKINAEWDYALTENAEKDLLMK